jgi:hypothetical protein
VSEIFFSMISPSQAPQSAERMQRKRINQASAVITSDEYLEAIQSLKKVPTKKSRSSRCRPASVAIVDEGDKDRDDDLPQLPPPLPKPLPAPRSPRKLRMPRKQRLSASAENFLASAAPTNASTSTSPQKKRVNVIEKPAEVNEKACLYCNEPSGRSREKWIRCRKCWLWAHNECAGISPSLTEYVCELCL